MGWVSRDGINITPPETLIEPGLTQEAVTLMKTGLEAGAISQETFHDTLTKVGVPMPSFGEEQARISAEVFGSHTVTDTP